MIFISWKYWSFLWTKVMISHGSQQYQGNYVWDTMMRQPWQGSQSGSLVFSAATQVVVLIDFPIIYRQFVNDILQVIHVLHLELISGEWVRFYLRYGIHFFLLDLIILNPCNTKPCYSRTLTIQTFNQELC